LIVGAPNNVISRSTGTKRHSIQHHRHGRMGNSRQ
jgi:hypothetical protein